MGISILAVGVEMIKVVAEGRNREKARLERNVCHRGEMVDGESVRAYRAGIRQNIAGEQSSNTLQDPDFLARANVVIKKSSERNGKHPWEVQLGETVE